MNFQSALRKEIERIDALLVNERIARDKFDAMSAVADFIMAQERCLMLRNLKDIINNTLMSHKRVFGEEKDHEIK